MLGRTEHAHSGTMPWWAGIVGFIFRAWAAACIAGNDQLATSTAVKMVKIIFDVAFFLILSAYSSLAAGRFITY